MSNASARADARAIMLGVAELGNKLVSYDDGSGPVSIIGFIDLEEHYSGDMESSAFNPARIAILLVEEVGEPQRGHIVIDEDDQEWMLVSHYRGDDFVTEWVVKRK